MLPDMGMGNCGWMMEGGKGAALVIQNYRVELVEISQEFTLLI